MVELLIIVLLVLACWITEPVKRKVNTLEFKIGPVTNK